jgi:hypothetical protein
MSQPVVSYTVSIEGKGWYFISCDSTESENITFYDVIHNYATKNTPYATYTIYPYVYYYPNMKGFPQGQTFNNNDWVSTTIDSSTIMNPDLGYWILIQNYSANPPDHNTTWEITQSGTTTIPYMDGYVIQIRGVASGGDIGIGGGESDDKGDTTYYFSQSGGGGAGINFQYGNSGDCKIVVASSGKVTFTFGPENDGKDNDTDGTIILYQGSSGIDYNNDPDQQDNVVQGGTCDISGIIDPDSNEVYPIYKVKISNDGLSGEAQKILTEYDGSDINVDDYAPDGGEPGLLLTSNTDGLQNNKFGFGSNGTRDDKTKPIFNINPYLYVQYVENDGSWPDPTDTVAYQTTVDGKTKSYNLPKNPNDYPKLIYLKDFSPQLDQTTEGTLKFLYPLQKEGTLEFGLTSGGGGGSSGTTQSGGYSGEGCNKNNTPDVIVGNIQAGTVLPDYTFHFKVGGGGSGGTNSSISGQPGLASSLTISQKDGSEQPLLSVDSVEGGEFPSSTTPSIPGEANFKTNVGPGEVGGSAPLTLSDRTGVQYPGVFLFGDNSRFGGSFGGGGAGGGPLGPGAGGKAGHGGLPYDLHLEQNPAFFELVKNGLLGGGGGGGAGNGPVVSSGGNGAPGVALMYLTAPPDFN